MCTISAHVHNFLYTGMLQIPIRTRFPFISLGLACIRRFIVSQGPQMCVPDSCIEYDWKKNRVIDTLPCKLN